MSVDLRTFSSTQQHRDTRAVQHGHTGTTLDRPETRQRRLLLTARSVAPQLSPSPVLPPRPRPCPPTSTRDDQPQHTPFRRLGSSTTARSPSQQELVLPTPLSSPLPARTDDQPRRGYYRRRGGDQRTDQLAVVAGGRGALLRVLRRGAGAERRSLQGSGIGRALSLFLCLFGRRCNHSIATCATSSWSVRSLALRCALAHSSCGAQVPGHAIWTGCDASEATTDLDWILEPMQRGGSVKTFIQHVTKG